MPKIEWKKERMRYVPIFLPVVGLAIGFLVYGLYNLLTSFDYEFKSITLAIAIVATYIILTGGLHIDALMDSADAHFSRRPLERKLQIMKDSNVGAFAVVTLLVVVLIKVATLNEILGNDMAIFLIFVPVISRVFQATMLMNSKFANTEGLAQMYEGAFSKKLKVFQFITLILISAIAIHINNNSYVLILSIAVFYLIYLNFCYRNFKGITGDLIGCFLELSEVVMFISILIMKVIGM